MARSRRRTRNEISIERNVVENTLMTTKDFVRDHRKSFLYALAGVFAVLIIVILVSLYLDHATNKNLVTFEKLFRQYREASNAGDKEKVNEIIPGLKELADSTWFGFSHEMSYYLIGNIFFDNGDYKEAKKYLITFAETASDSFFTEMALLKAGVADENLGNYSDALKTYKLFEEDYNDSLIAEQLYYNMASVYESTKNIAKAREYYNKVINTYPQSVYARRAKKRVFLLGTLRK